MSLFVAGGKPAWAKPKKPATKAQKVKHKSKATAQRTVKIKQKTVAQAQLDPAAEFEVIEQEAAGLDNARAANPDDAQSNQMLTELALRAVRAAEKALSRGDDAMFAAYSSQFRKRFANSAPGLETMAGRGIGAADYALGAIQLHGLVAEKSVERACTHFAAAVEKGFRGARFRHAQCIEESDPATAFALIRDAADAGHVAANERMGRICLEAEPPDAACAFARLERAARDGRASAITLLGWMHAEGIGGTPDLARAFRYYQDGAKHGEVSAHNNLGEMFENGRGVAKDPKAAFEHYLAAATGGNAQGQYNVGRLYVGGRGTARDLDQARRWLSSADKAGIAQAREILQLLEQNSNQAN